MVFDNVVGSFDSHNQWHGYDKYMFPFANGKGESLIGIDFGCGPGRNIVKYASTFRRLDGVNISEANLINAGEYLRQNGIDDSQLFLGSGNDLGAAPSGQI